MPEYYDALETRQAEIREREQFARVREIIAGALTAPGWARHLAGVDPRTITDRVALARLPLLRKSDLAALQKEHPPFGGFNVAPPGKFARLLMSPGSIFEPERAGEDVWGAARALFAAGFRAGDIVHNAFSYHLTPGGFIMELVRMRSAAPSFPAAPARPNSNSRRWLGSNPPAMSARRIF